VFLDSALVRLSAFHSVLECAHTIMIEDDTIESTNQLAERQSTRQDLAGLVLRCLIAAGLIATMTWLLASYLLDLLVN